MRVTPTTLTTFHSGSPALQAASLQSEPLGKSVFLVTRQQLKYLRYIGEMAQSWLLSSRTKLTRSLWQKRGRVRNWRYSVGWSQWGNCNPGRVKQRCGWGFHGKANIGKKMDPSSASSRWGWKGSLPSHTDIHVYLTVSSTLAQCKFTGSFLHALVIYSSLHLPIQQWNFIFSQQVTNLFL